jgi:hypothetical protein
LKFNYYSPRFFGLQQGGDLTTNILVDSDYIKYGADILTPKRSYFPPGHSENLAKLRHHANLFDATVRGLVADIMSAQENVVPISHRRDIFILFK